MTKIIKTDKPICHCLSGNLGLDYPPLYDLYIPTDSQELKNSLERMKKYYIKSTMPFKRDI
jgi:hypothetical protein